MIMEETYCPVCRRLRIEYRGSIYPNRVCDMCDQHSIFNAPSDLLRRIACARSVSARLEGHNGSIEKEFTRRNIARVRKFIRDNPVGDTLRPDAVEPCTAVAGDEGYD